ncbi:hypothetical protein ANCCEY_04258 [Ancylostoma ceylanicum]|uniref:RNA-dependent RNA polymerase n=1 Tax=Ancylostoma ceylanicum TaxID=53326 RepID=A0A0D6LZJ0_9BILA|nr:hypothetical protein ANCCEY_04258 [Ancylostoma ceylanicum]
MVDTAVAPSNRKSRERIHFELNSPVIIRNCFRADSEKKFGIKRERWRVFHRGRSSNEEPHVLALTESPIFTVEFDSLPMVDVLYSSKDCPYARWTTANSCTNAATSSDDRIFKDFLHETVREQDVAYNKAKCTRPPDWVKDTVRERMFSLTYLIECLISRGAVVKDQLLLDVATWLDFLTVVSKCYLRNREALVREFENQCEDQITYELSKEEIKRGYRKVRKVVITPTRTIYVVPETLMPNRVLRGYDHDGTRVLRVTFRDDDNQQMRISKTSYHLIKTTLRDNMINGFEIAGRSFGYLGNSNSQMRDAGAYFMEKYSHHEYLEYTAKNKMLPLPTWQPKIDQVRHELGDFTKMENIYKLMARLGQCFTQSMESSVHFEREEYFVMPDIIGGCNREGDHYVFSDGVGMVSKAFAKQIAEDMMLGKCVPSCFQFRFRGMKGVLAVNPVLDEYASWARANNLEGDTGMFAGFELQLVFRDSQVKFKTHRRTKEAVEIVKYSTPSPVALNKPFICILDQVSQMQSYDCHVRVTNRIEQLAEEQLRSSARSLLYEKECRNKLKQFPIPNDKGRTMLGVIDDTGQLQYGQVFVQYTEHVTLKTPPPYASKKVLTGKVMLTKSPSVVAGDVRIFTAVDIPDLHHLCDVVVFPQHGPRPHPDEMAGSDLDGDEYAVIWDEGLMLETSEEAFDYTADKPEYKPINVEKMTEDMVEFYINYITQDSIGTIANSFQFQADLYGLKSEGIMENYGIKSEAEVFSGCIAEMRNRISDRDQDDMSFFTTNELIEQKMTILFREFREGFFEEFGGWRNCVKQAVNPNMVSDDVLDHYIGNPPRCMQRKAVAYYRTCYGSHFRCLFGYCY